VRPQTIPRTGSGKVRYGALRELLAGPGGVGPG
jgi:acyl-coenzyme A synthetase/AMP-(fatty) acid ligase